MKFSQQKALSPSSNQCWSSLSSFCHKLSFFSLFPPFFKKTVQYSDSRSKTTKEDFPPLLPHPDRMILSHNSQSKQCSANHTWHANVKTVLPQEWSLFRYGVSRSWLLSSKQTQVVQQEIHRFRGTGGLLLLFFTI